MYQTRWKMAHTLPVFRAPSPGWAFTMATDVLGSYDELGEDPFFGVFIARAERMEAEIMSKDANPNVLRHLS